MFKQLLAIIVLFCLISCSESADSQQEKPETAITPEISDTTINQERPKLDLSFPENIDTELNTNPDFKAHEVLPNLFKNTTEKKKIAVGGKFITDPSQENYADSVEGAEIKIEIQTD